MKHKVLIFTGLTIILLALFALLIYLINTPQTTTFGTSPNELKTCNTLSFSKENAINLVFFSPESEAQRYSDFLFNIAPLDTHKEDFNIYYIDSNPECSIYKEVAILCHSKELIKQASSCPNDYIAVLKEAEPRLRSSAYQNVMSINTRHPLTVLAHEFGHALANLAEEYKTNTKIPSNSKNCIKSCPFPNEADGCFQECTKSNYYRSIENGVMRTLSSDEYGIYNEFLIENRINEDIGLSLGPLTGKATDSEESCQSQSYVLIEALYNSNTNTISETATSLETGCPGSPGYGPFEYAITDAKDNTITEGDTNIEFIWTDAPGEKEIIGDPFLSDRPFLIKTHLSDGNLKIKHYGETTTIPLANAGATACKN